jgi:hypothetical protein
MKYLICLIAMCGWGLCYSQLDSVFVEAQFVENPSQAYGLDTSELSMPVFQARVVVNDLTDVGMLTVQIFDAADVIVKVAQYDSQPIIAGDAIDNGAIVFNFAGLDPQQSYRVLVQPQNVSQAYLEFVTAYYN